MIEELNQRSLEIFRHIVESYVDTGEPVGSRTISRRLNGKLSAATIRNVMADLEDNGLLSSSHTSAGRKPTDQGFRLFVDGLLEVGNLSPDERRTIERKCEAVGHSTDEMLTEATSLLSGLSACAGVVVAPKQESSFTHIEFVPLSRLRALAVMVAEDGTMENRVIDLPEGILPSTLTQAANYLNSRLSRHSLDEVRLVVQRELELHTAELDELTARVVEAGLATRLGDGESGTLIVRGQANLLADVGASQRLERIRALFQLLETKRDLIRLLERTQDADGVHIFIGAEHELFALTDCSTIVAPFRDSEGRVVGAIGVIGPTRLNYGRIIPLVDHTARVVSRLMG
ncbi:MAG: heat-inducible transcriptional repressor HrcA [Alphaproteobacteria bacterium]|nr:heat-inducible transcriptional repressor HrcA [Alphaproteobacteria bacterium]